MNKTFYFTALIAVFLIANYALKLRPIARQSGNQFSFNIPKIPSIKPNLKSTTAIGNFSVWAINKPAGKKAHPNAKEQNKQANENVEYSYKEFNNIPAIYRVKNENYRWEFYGTFLRNSQLLAIFFNPALKKDNIKVVGKGDIIDTNLKVKRLSNNEVTVQYDTKTPFVLKIFNIDEKWTRRKNL